MVNCYPDMEVNLTRYMRGDSQAPVTEIPVLAPNKELLESKAPREHAREAPCEAAEGLTICHPSPPAETNPRPVVCGSTRDGGKEGPMWRAALRA